MPKLVIVGSMAFDSVKTPFGEHNDILGGSATYSSYAASFFADPGVVAVVGEDFPQEHLKMLAERDIDVSGIKKEGKTFRWKGFYEYDMNEAKTVDTQLNSFEHFKPQLPDDYKEADYLFLANINPELQLDVLNQVTRPKLVMLDSMNLWIDTAKEKLLEVIKKVDLLLLNDGEARQLFDTPNLAKAGKQALALGPKYVIFKKGEHGALLFSDGKFFSAPGYPLEVIKDPTGCGDSFAGALIGYLARTDDISEANMRRAIVFGSVVASFNAEDFSLNRMKDLTYEDIEARFKEFEEIRQF